METIAQVNEILPVVSGTSMYGEWKKQVVVFCYHGTNKMFLVSFMRKRHLEIIANLKKGDTVNVVFELTARLVGDKYFTDVKGEDIIQLVPAEQAQNQPWATPEVAMPDEATLGVGEKKEEQPY